MLLWVSIFKFQKLHFSKTVLVKSALTGMSLIASADNNNVKSRFGFDLRKRKHYFSQFFKNSQNKKSKMFLFWAYHITQILYMASFQRMKQNKKLWFISWRPNILRNQKLSIFARVRKNIVLIVIFKKILFF